MELRIKFLPTLFFCLLSLFTTFLVIHNLDYSISLSFNQHHQQKHSTTNQSIFFWGSAYWEQLNSGFVRIRILAFSKCFLQTSPNFIQLELQTSEGGHLQLQPKIQSVESDCPWHWAKGCEWNSFVIDAETTLESIENNGRIIVVSKQDNNKSTSLPLLKSQEHNEDGLNVCIPPLYWYTDWLKLSLFIEIWKLSGASHFYFYVQSISKTVEAFLNEYKLEGVVTVIEWPLLPRNTSFMPEDPNQSIYRFGHLLAQNDCRFRIKHKFGVVVDVDEIILPLDPEVSLLQFLRTKLKAHPMAGSFTFRHSRMHFPKWPKSDEEWRESFAWMEKITVTEKEGPTKAIFISDRADLISTHKIRKHFGSYHGVEIPSKEAKLLHFRRNWTYKDSENDYEIDIFGSNKQIISTNMASIFSKIGNLKLNYTASNLISSCLKGWQDAGCKTPFTSCYDKLSKVDDWVISKLSPFVVAFFKLN